ncbi:MAG: hypothetical protein AB7N80_09145 [Bdellovibrionales bacterium]
MKIKNRGLFYLALAAMGLSSLNAFAFVENVTHGYQSCRACHLSPSGGGVLTEYGRSLSRELMSTWGPEGIEGAGFGLIPEGENFRIGGDVRSVQTYINNDQKEESRYFRMQQNVELALRAGKTWFIGTFGTQEGPKSVPERGEFLSERHYLLYDAAENLTVRIGKFRLNHGINDPNHTRVTKAGLSFGALSETYNLEVGVHSEKSELFVTSSIGALDQSRMGNERALAASYGHYVAENAKLGVSAFIGENEDTRRELLGLWGVTPLFGEKMVLLGEMDYQESTDLTPSREKTRTLAGHTRLGYHLFKGFTPYVVYEYLHSNMFNEDKIKSPGVGFQFLPLPHLEFQAEYQRQSGLPAAGLENDSVFLLLHFYL